MTNCLETESQLTNRRGEHGNMTAAKSTAARSSSRRASSDMAVEFANFNPGSNHGIVS